MSTQKLEIKTPRWCLPLLEPARYKGIKGGRGSGKSHFAAELLVEEHIMNPDQKTVCIREIQKSLKFSSKSLIESKIKALGVSHMFEVLNTEIRRIGGDGIIIFQGLQDHTADSIKSLEGFDRAWCEESQSLSARSIQLLRPTIRKDGSQLWFTWNPDQSTDAIEQLLVESTPDNAIVIHVNYDQNPFIPDTLLEEMEHDRLNNPDTFDHVWNGGYNVISERQIFNGKWTVDEFEPSEFWDGPYCGLDFGFSQDPTAAVECYIHGERLYIYREAGKRKLELDDTAAFIDAKMPGFSNHTVRGDSARPESISYLQRHGMPRIEGVKKWAGSVEDGIEFLKSFKQIVIHVQCQAMQQEARLYSYDVNKAGDILPKVKDAHNHYWDAVRYALAPLIQAGRRAGVLF